MREKWQKQMPLMSHILDHPQSRELEVISSIIDANPNICGYILQDLNKGKFASQRAGAKGMSVDQVLRCLIVKTLFSFTYEELAFHIVDSLSLRWFCRIGMAEEGFKKSALNRNIKVVSDKTWETINRDILGFAKHEKIEKGRTIRTDCTCVESNIHKPRDSNQLWDCVRVLTRLITRSRDEFGLKVPGFSNHTRRVKRRMLSILNAKNKKHGENVATRDKVVSIFEPHTDVIVKDRRETIFGHKICLTGGASNLILDCMIVVGGSASKSS